MIAKRAFSHVVCDEDRRRGIMAVKQNAEG